MSTPILSSSSLCSFLSGHRIRIKCNSIKINVQCSFTLAKYLRTLKDISTRNFKISPCCRKIPFVSDGIA